MKEARFASSTLFLALIAVIVLPGTTPEAQADIKLFRNNQAPIVLKTDLIKTKISIKPLQLNRGLITQQILRLIDRNKAAFGLKKVNGEILELRAVHNNRMGAAFRFIQRYNRVRIENAEMAAVFDSSGNNLTINSGLVATPNISVQPDISREEALKAAIEAGGYKNAEQSEATSDSLLITHSNGQPLLVWQFYLREKEDGSNPAQIRVLAQGKSAGKIQNIHRLANYLNGKISIYDATITVVIPNPIYKGVKVLENGKRVQRLFKPSKDAWEANDNLQKTRDFYNQTFGRLSYDGKGADINGVVNVQKFKFMDILGMRQNAAWVGPWKMMIFGAGGSELAGFTEAIDVIGHEYTHAVVSSTSNLESSGQPGALNEHLADLFGAMINQHYNNPENPFLIGATVLRGEFAKKAKALRDMLHPHDGLDKQPENMSEIDAAYGNGCQPSDSNDNCGVHLLNGVPNRAVALVIEKLGWETIKPLFYRVMTARLLPNHGFANYRDQVLDECENTLSGQSCEVIRDAFHQVGL